MRYFLIDKITHVTLGEKVSALKAITLTDPILHDHFPDYPIFPGTLILEGVAQAAGFLLETTFNQKEAPIKRAVLVQVEKYKIYGPTGPAEVLQYECHIGSLLEDAGRVSFEVKEANSGTLRAKGIIIFQMMSIDSANVSKQRIDIYKIWTKGLENCPQLR
jgi:3-hydroxyacyl-[acyl-carrier-protein] dehydratase